MYKERKVVVYAMSKEEMQKPVYEAVTAKGVLLTVFEKTEISRFVAPIADNLGEYSDQRAVLSLTLEAVE